MLVSATTRRSLAMPVPERRPQPAAAVDEVDEQADDDVVLAAAIAAGEPAALGDAYTRYGRLVYSISYRITHDAGLAEECTQDAFVALWRRASSFDPQRGRLATWLLAVARNRSIDLVRQRSRASGALPGPESADTEQDPAELATVADQAQRLAEAMATLPPSQLESLQLAYFEGLTHGEIAERLGLPLGTVKGRIRLGLERLRALPMADLESA